MPTKKATKEKKRKAKIRARTLGLNAGPARMPRTDCLPIEHDLYAKMYYPAIYGKTYGELSAFEKTLVQDTEAEREVLRAAQAERDRRGVYHDGDPDYKFKQKPARYQAAVRELQAEIAARDAAMPRAVPDVATSLDAPEV